MKLINDLKCKMLQKAIYGKLHKGHKPNEWEPWRAADTLKTDDGLICKNDICYSEKYPNTVIQKIGVERYHAEAYAYCSTMLGKDNEKQAYDSSGKSESCAAQCKRVDGERKSHGFVRYGLYYRRCPFWLRYGTNTCGFGITSHKLRPIFFQSSCGNGDDGSLLKV